MKKLTLSTLIFLFSLSILNSANIRTVESNDFIRNSYQMPDKNENGYYKYKSFDIDEDALFNMMRNSKTLEFKNFPVNTETTSDITLTRKTTVVDGNTKFLSQGADGEIMLTAPDVSYFEGSIKNYPESKVYLINIDGIVYGMISFSANESYILAPSNKEKVSIGNYAIVNQKNLIDKKINPIDFKIEDKISELKSKTIDKKLSLDWSKLLEVGLALETDTEFYKACGSDLKKSQAYAIALINMVSIVYTREVNVSIYIKWLKTWTDSPADPYNVKGDAYSLPPKVLEYWKNNYSSVERDLVHVVTSIGYGGGGFGYYDALCHKAGDNSFSVSSVQGNHNYPTSDFTYDIYIIAHEIGHNFNAAHTHSCAYGYPLDTCVIEDGIQGKCLDSNTKAKPNPGSIMSYCGGTNNSAGLGYFVRMMFLQQSKDDIRNTALNAVCLKEPANPVIYLNTPVGSEIFKPNDTIRISWSASKVNGFNLYFSTDDGTSWIVIAKNLIASQSNYSWIAPDICNNHLIIKVSDSANDSLFAKSLIPFTIYIEDPDGLIAYYPFSENTIDAQQCHNYNLKSNSSVVYATDRISSLNSAVSFDGKSYLYNSTFPFKYDELTFSYWFYQSDNSGKCNIIGSNYQEGWVAEIYTWGLYGASYYVDGQGSPKQIWGGSPSLNQWHHGAFTWDGNSAKLYLDGVKVGELSDGKHTLNKFPSTPIYIGSRKDNDYFKGKLDDISIYKRALTGDEILKLYNRIPTTVRNYNSHQSELSVTPNPASDYISINTSEINRRVNPTVDKVEIYSIEGILMQSTSPQPSPFSERAIQIDVSGFVPGVYFVKIGDRVQRFVKM